MAEAERRTVQLAGETDAAGFRSAARRLLAAGVSPDAVHWQVPQGTGDDLLASPPEPAALPDDAAEPAPPLQVPAFYPPLCEKALLHASPARFGLLYRLLWRLRHEPALRHDPLDEDRLYAEQLARAVSVGMHKMTAFVRFRPIGEEAEAETDADADAPAPEIDPSSQRWHVAWFEPEHHIVEATAPFFVRRFAQMRWAILTPLRCVRWDGRSLSTGPGARRDQAPPPDAGEQLWLTYYEHIFNPARLKLKTMQKEMPRRYWANLPEAVLIQPLAADAARRSGRMVEQPALPPAHRRPAASLALRLTPPATVSSAERASADVALMEDAAAPAQRSHSPGRAAPVAITSLTALRRATEHCRQCPLGALATQAVNGEGPPHARLMLIGEQPGDQEDLRGRPFVGPAGQLLDRALAQLGWPRDALYLTNAVRHFKYELRGKRRIHKSPGQREIAACLHWLESEIGLVKPEAAIALGATAARALLGRPVGVTSERGRWLRRDDGLPVLVTLHPSALLRTAPEEQEAAYRAWLQDLALANAWGQAARRID